MNDIPTNGKQEVSDCLHIKLDNFTLKTDSYGSISIYGTLKAFPETYGYPYSPIRLQADFIDNSGSIVKICHSLFTYGLKHTNYFGFYIPCGNVDLSLVQSIEVYPVFLSYIEDADEQDWGENL